MKSNVMLDAAHDNGALAPVDRSDSLSYTIPQFCAAYHFSRVYYYTLKAQGKAPKELRFGRRVVITRKCAEEWEARMLQEQTDGGDSIEATASA
ncbi:hypothetical protein [Burkholderia gladioli]|uniref:hypothetical protein n=1 Tax=Burkholderia gladioli TaxID=28095 RepID=UPI00163FDF00|nr:hypothetical protein [Burkholderia gladioli]MBJ9675245.1 hypothetical protein [Burkholderia gladioli]MDN7463497.1 hypothetical protein [Burkholderia gladioli]